MHQVRTENQQGNRSRPARSLSRVSDDVATGAPKLDIELNQLRRHIRTLITLDETEAPMLSCYVNRSSGLIGLLPPHLDQRVRAIRKALRGQDLTSFEVALGRIQKYLGTEVRRLTRGIAVFARAGTRPFFLGLQFQVPLPNQLSLNTTPDIFNLVELKDTYDRYVVLISTEHWARILEVNLGAVTRELWSERQELRERAGREWTHEHYQNHRQGRGEQFFREKIEILEKLMAGGGHTHLILAGSPQMTARLRDSLPRHLQAKLVDVVNASANAPVADVVLATLSSFINYEQQESLDAVAELVSAVRRSGLATAGTSATLEALRRGQADVLVMAQAYEPGWAWSCADCGRAAATLAAPLRCPSCNSRAVQSENIKELMVKLAERQSVEVEFVQASDALMDLGGVGCFLRYATPEHDQPSTMPRTT